jgi:hypothetical protein
VPDWTARVAATSHTPVHGPPSHHPTPCTRADRPRPAARHPGVTS